MVIQKPWLLNGLAATICHDNHSSLSLRSPRLSCELWGPCCHHLPWQPLDAVLKPESALDITSLDVPAPVTAQLEQTKVLRDWLYADTVVCILIPKNNTISENYLLAKVSLFLVFEPKLKGQHQRYQVLHQFHNVNLRASCLMTKSCSPTCIYLEMQFKISFDILRILLYQWSWKKETMKMIWYLFVGKDEQRGFLEFLLLDEFGKLITRLGKTVPVTAVHHKYNSCNRQNNRS